MRYLIGAVLCLLVSTAYAFENPDGSYGRVGLEPFFHYMNAGEPKIQTLNDFEPVYQTYDFSESEFGLRLIAPSSILFGKVERATFFLGLSYIKLSENSSMLGDERETRKNQNAYTFDVSVRYWFGQ